MNAKKSHTGKTQTGIARGIAEAITQTLGPAVGPPEQATDQAAYARDHAVMAAAARRMTATVNGIVERTKRGTGC